MNRKAMLEKIMQPHRSYGLDLTIVSRGTDRVVSVMPVQDKMLNPSGTVNAGAMIWLADVAATILAFENMNADGGRIVFPILVDLHTTVLSNVSDGELTAKARIVRHGSRMTVVRTRVLATGEKVLAEITSTHLPSA